MGYREISNKQGGSVWIGRGGGSSDMAIPLFTFEEETRHQKLYKEI